jgi:type II secretory pathway pseudopilin PulG
LVELLVVIGIIALLIAILLPTLARAREAAARTACAAKLHAIMIAATVHRADHRDYYPLCGALTGATGPQLGDTYSQFYDYRDTSDVRYSSLGLPLPSPSITSINIALAAEMGFKNAMLDTYDQWSVDRIDPTNYPKLFLCPSDNFTQAELADLRGPLSPMILAVPTTNVTWISTALSSYIFNEYVLGYNDTYGRLRGKASSIHQPAATFFACDGLAGAFVFRPTGDFSFATGSLTLFNNFPNLSVKNPQLNSISLGDVISGATYKGTLPLAGAPGTPVNFDTARHHMKMNIACCDGHVELDNVTAAGLNNVYLMAP